MKLDKALQQFANEWVKNMKQKAPYRTGRLRDSIEAIDRPEPVIDMVYYGQFVDQGTKYQKAQHFVDKSFKETTKEFEEDFSEEVFDQITVLFDKTFDK